MTSETPPLTEADNTPLERVLARLTAKGYSRGYLACCPAHGDRHPSLMIWEDPADAHVGLKCLTGCTRKAIVEAIGLSESDLYVQSKPRALRPLHPGISMIDLAVDKLIHPHLLDQLGVTDITYKGRPAVQVPYHQMDGSASPRFRIRTALTAKEGSAWSPGSASLVPYGLHRLAEARAAKYLVVVEGESDCWTLWLWKFPALGLPGAAMYNALEPDMLTGIERVYVLQEPDKAGNQLPVNVSKRLLHLGYTGKVYALNLAEETGAKDPNDLHKRDCKGFKATFETLLGRARPLFTKGSPEKKRPQTITLSALMRKELPPVKWAIPGILPEGLTLLCGKPKMGKAQPLDASILTPHGWRNMGALVVGDQVIGLDGRSTTVIGVHPQGRMAIYRVLLSDGTSVEATGDHLWLVETHNDRVCGRNGTMRTTAEIAALLAQGDTRSTYLPMAEPVEFVADGVLPLDPYVLGLLLGDGGLTKGVTFTSADESLFDALCCALPAGVRLHRFPDRRSGSVAGTAPRACGRSPNPVREALELLGLLGKKSEQKFVPMMYLRASVAERMALLQGLLDTDGGIDQEAVLFYTSSWQLACNVQEMVESLGGTAQIGSKKVSFYRKDGERKTGQTSYRVRVRLPMSLGCPFRLERKAALWTATRTMTKRRPVRKIVAVEYVGEKLAQCITVAAADGLYITEHCIVTHNSWLVLGFALAIACGGHVLGKVQVEQGQVLYLDLEDNERRLQRRAKQVLHELHLTPDAVHVALSWPRLDQGGIKHLETWLSEHPETRLVIVDTWTKLAPRLQGQKRTQYEEEYDALTPLKELADKLTISILAVTHLRKMLADDVLDEISGTTGLTGAVDGFLVLKRERGQQVAALHVIGRDIEEEQALALSFDQVAATWTLEGKVDEVQKRHLSQERQAILDLLREHPTGLSPKDIADKLGKNFFTVRNTLRKMADEHLIGYSKNSYCFLDPLEERHASPGFDEEAPLTHHADANERGIDSIDGIVVSRGIDGIGPSSPLSALGHGTNGIVVSPTGCKAPSQREHESPSEPVEGDEEVRRQGGTPDTIDTTQIIAKQREQEISPDTTDTTIPRDTIDTTQILHHTSLSDSSSEQKDKEGWEVFYL